MHTEYNSYRILVLSTIFRNRHSAASHPTNLEDTHVTYSEQFNCNPHLRRLPAHVLLKAAAIDTSFIEKPLHLPTPISLLPSKTPRSTYKPSPNQILSPSCPIALCINHCRRCGLDASGQRRSLAPHAPQESPPRHHNRFDRHPGLLLCHRHTRLRSRMARHTLSTLLLPRR